MSTALVFVTSSDGKFREAGRLSRLPLERVDVELPEPQSLDVTAIVRAKAGHAYALLGRPLIVEDTALELAALGGFPGPLVKWLTAAAGVAALPRILADYSDRSATAHTAIGFADQRGIFVVNGTVVGTIVAPRGDDGFGWDVVFQPEGEARTFAEMTGTEKDAISHRGAAFRQLREALIQRRRQTGDFIPIEG